MGKTTYCKKLAYDWAAGNQKSEDGFPKFEIVLLLRCRDMKSDLWEAIDDQLLPRDVKKEVSERFFKFIRRNQSNVLLILDGLDEVPANKLPMFSEILQGRVLPKCRLVATARHEVGIKVRIHCDTLLEIDGFTIKDAQNFIVKYFKTRDDLAQKLLLKLENDRKLATLARNPLNTALLCLFCEDRQGEFPKNRGQLYQEVVQCILRRYRKKEGLPETEEDLLEVYKTQLKHLGWIAFEGLLKDSLDFEESKLASHSEDIPRFGFLSIQPGSSKLRPCRHYSFLHKSFQEWLAAFYLCCQLVEGKISPEKLLNELVVFEDDDYCPYKEDFREVLCFALNILAARCEELVVALIKSMAVRVQDNVKIGYDGRDWFILASQCIEEFERDNSNLFVKLAHGFGSSLKCKSLHYRNYINNLVVFSVIVEVLKVNTTVDSMYVFGGTGHVNASFLADALKVNTTLTALIMTSSGIGQSAARFAEALRVNKTLAKLTLNDCSIGEDGFADLADALKVNTTLTELSLRGRNIGDQSAARFADALRVNKTLTKMTLGKDSCNISEDGAADLVDALKVNTTLKELTLPSNGIGDQGAGRLAEALRVNKTLTTLDLSHNKIGYSGAACLADVLKSNTGLLELGLSRNKIDMDGVACLIDALKHNTTIAKLHLLDINRNLLNQADIYNPQDQAVYNELFHLQIAGRVYFC